MFRLERITEEVRDAVADLDPACMPGSDAAHLAAVAAEGERLFAAAKLLLAHHAAGTGGWARTSHAKSAEHWLADTSGCSVASARDALSAARQLDSLPATAERLRSGDLSIAQVTHVAAAATIDPSAEEHLLHVADRDSLRSLGAEKERVIAAASDDLAGRELAHRERHLRHWTLGAATHGSFSGPTDQVAVLLAALEPLEREAFDAARKDERHEPHAAYRFDALVALAGTAGNGKAVATGRSSTVRVRVDATALRRGSTEPGEVCEIPGVGPVSVAYARRAIGGALLELVVTDGTDVRAVVSTAQTIPKALRLALEERDQTCKVQGCDVDHNLEVHHLWARADGGPWSYHNCGRVCPEHHDLITYRGYTVAGSPDGSWSLRAPPHAAAA